MIQNYYLRRDIMRNGFRQMRIIHAASIITIIITSLVFSQSQLKNDEIKKTQLNEVIIEETWRGFSWNKNTKITRNYDTNQNCINVMKENWNGTRWEKETLEKYSYDKLHRKLSSEFYSWNMKTGKWELVEGSREVFDTLNNKSNKVVLYEAVWNPSKKRWDSSDSIYYDKKNRIIKSVSKEISISDYNNDTLIIIETNDYNYQTDKIWVETNKVWRSDTKKTDIEKYRYRQIKTTPTQVYMIDIWDDRMNRWIPNTASLYRIYSDNIETDSIEEIINNEPVPVYVSSKIKDNDGNVMVDYYWSKSVDEKTGKWNGTYVKWQRECDNNQKRVAIVESVFVADSNGSQWQLKSYQNETCKIPSAGNIVENGNFEFNINLWSFERSFDTLINSGINLTGEEYFDEEKKKWMPTLKFTSKVGSDSTVISTELLDMDNGQWSNDSMFVVRYDKDGKIISKTNHVWARAGLLNGDWVKASRQTYIYGKE